ncbi:hypothetical protein KC316_g20332, partial [Hortaea werneckii]
MVGKREFYRAADSAARGYSKRGSEDVRPVSGNDIESGFSSNANANGRPLSSGNARPRPKIWSFRDAANTAMEDQRREHLKKNLL